MNLFRDTVKPAFQPIRRKSHYDAQLLRINSTDCSNEVEDNMLPWLLEDLIEDTSLLTIQ